MLIDEAKNVFGSDAELTRQMGLRRQTSVYNWRREGRDLIPELYARRLAAKHPDKLKFRPELYGLTH